ncbi:MAG TPA: hypothetical protein VH257_08755 [Chloroflexota bacterium]|nr:hypothetical protein [Chloroflexota bacterium]HEX2514780.1 hypothetical protein [Chloroflexota bacterium]
MPYSHRNARGQTYYLHAKQVTLQNGRPLSIYYFAPRPKPEEAVEALPEGYQVLEKARNGLPFLKRASLRRA